MAEVNKYRKIGRSLYKLNRQAVALYENGRD